MCSTAVSVVSTSLLKLLSKLNMDVNFLRYGLKSAAEVKGRVMPGLVASISPSRKVQLRMIVRISRVGGGGGENLVLPRKYFSKLNTLQNSKRRLETCTSFRFAGKKIVDTAVQGVES